MKLGCVASSDQTERDDPDVDAERGERPAAADRDVDAGEDEQERPEA